MPEEFVLTRGVLAKSATLPLTADEYQQLKEAKSVILEALALEERIGLVLDNYIEYEALLLRGALERLVYGHASWSDFTGEIHTVNRYLLNLLSAARSYLDQLRHFASAFFGKTSVEHEQVETWMREQYDALLGYRTMEALRNFAQHRGLGVHHLKFEFWWLQDRSASRSAMVPGIQPSRLREEGGFKEAVLDELMGDVVDIRRLVKEYVSGITIVHGRVRDLLRPRVTGADQTFLGAIERYKTEGEDQLIGLLAAHVREDGTWAEEVHLFADLVMHRRVLERKQRVQTNLWMHFVTNEPK